MAGVRLTDAEALRRLLKRVEVLPSGCWRFKGRLSECGYGQVKYHGQTIGAHRASFMLHGGRLEKGEPLDHKCHDPKTCFAGNNCPHRACVNPTHVEATTHLENISPGRRYGKNIAAAVAAHRKSMSARTNCRNGHELTPNNTYFYINGSGGRSRSCVKCRNAASARFKASGMTQTAAAPPPNS